MVDVWSSCLLKTNKLINIMPNLDKTGPMGQGPRTGRGFGSCGNGMSRGFGCGGCRCGRGFGFRRFFSPKNELTTLEEEEKMLEEELKALREEKDALMKSSE